MISQLEGLYLRADRLLGGRLSVIVRTALAFDQDDGALVSRSIAYYALFSIFPLLLLLVSVASIFLDTEEASRLVLGMLENVLPTTADMVKANLQQVIDARSTVGILASLGLLWSASGVFTAIYRAVNRAWGNPKSELFWSEKLYGIAVVLIAGALLIGSTLYSTAISILRSRRTIFWDWLPAAGADAGGLAAWLSTLLPILISMLVFAILYRTIPQNQIAWRDVWAGGLLAGLIWELGRRLYAWYLANFASYSLVYGSVGVIIGFLLWSYLSAMILLLGAELTAQHTHWRRAGKPLETRPLRQWMDAWSKEELTWEKP
ncbi:MAG: YihY/virulence factor BrkB family protein [Anaerolineae bacterium]|jgi:YihY family inner membrane protein